MYYFFKEISVIVKENGNRTGNSTVARFVYNHLAAILKRNGDRICVYMFRLSKFKQN